MTDPEPCPTEYEEWEAEQDALFNKLMLECYDDGLCNGFDWGDYENE